MANFVRDSNKLLDVQNSASQMGGATSCPFVIILSDGRFNKQNVRRYMQEAHEKRYLYIFVILDAIKPGKNETRETKDKAGILSLRSAIKADNGTGIKLVPYLRDFPFSYYCIVNDLNQLPSALGSILVQWFSIMSGSSS
jgi:midasin